MLYVIGVLEDAKDKGLVDGGSHLITGKGKEALDSLRKSGFRPTDEEMRETVRFLATPSEELAREHQEMRDGMLRG